MAHPQGRASQHGYPRVLRVNALLQEVLAEAIERLADRDERLLLVTVTGVSCDPDLRHAVVFVASLDDEVAEALEEHRRQLQGLVASQVRMKRVPALRFLVDPAVVAGTRVEDAIERAHERDQQLRRERGA